MPSGTCIYRFIGGARIASFGVFVLLWVARNSLLSGFLGFIANILLSCLFFFVGVRFNANGGLVRYCVVRVFAGFDCCSEVLWVRCCAVAYRFGVARMGVMSGCCSVEELGGECYQLANCVVFSGYLAVFQRV